VHPRYFSLIHFANTNYTGESVVFPQAYHLQNERPTKVAQTACDLYTAKNNRYKCVEKPRALVDKLAGTAGFCSYFYGLIS
jgi:hypothetical protein